MLRQRRFAVPSIKIETVRDPLGLEPDVASLPVDANGAGVRAYYVLTGLPVVA